MKYYNVRGFAAEFETSESRKLKHLPWIALPTKQEGDGYTELMDHPNGCAHFGAWTAILQLAAKCSPRGALIRDLGGRKLAHDYKSISRITRVPESILAEAIPRLMELGWLEELELASTCDNLPTHARVPADDGILPGAQDRTGQDITGQERTDPPPAQEVGEKGKTADDGLREFLKENRCKTDRAGESILDEWRVVCKGLKPKTVREIIEQAKPGIQWPSEFKKHREARGI
jgi:hypothetical protein